MNNQVPETQSKKSGFSLNGIVNMVVKYLPIIAVVFFGVAVISFGYNVLEGIINAFVYKSFGTFMNGVESAFSHVAQYLFYGVLLCAVNKICKK